MTRRIPVAERHARLATRHRLAKPAIDPVEVAASMVGLHSSDPATVFLSTRARLREMKVADLEAVLYQERSLARILAMRRTLWVVPTTLAAVVNSSSTAALVGRQLKRTAQMIESQGIATDGVAWAKRVCELVVESLGTRKEATAREITEDVPELAQKITFYKKDGSWAGEMGVSTRILFFLATEGRVVRVRPLGTWISGQYRWSTVENWFGSRFVEVDRDEAQSAVVRSWLSAFGPATETDIKWWTGWPVTQVRRALSTVGAVKTELDDGPGLVLPDDVGPVEDPGPWVALLPSLDPTVMGWKERSWYLGEYAETLFDRNGNAGPTVWVNGRVVGGWAQRKTGEVVYELFEDVGASATSAIAEEAERLRQWMGDIVVTPRFKSPHTRALTA